MKNNYWNYVDTLFRCYIFGLAITIFLWWSDVLRYTGPLLLAGIFFNPGRDQQGRAQGRQAGSMKLDHQALLTLNQDHPSTAPQPILVEREANTAPACIGGAYTCTVAHAAAGLLLAKGSLRLSPSPLWGLWLGLREQPNVQWPSCNPFCNLSRDLVSRVKQIPPHQHCDIRTYGRGKNGRQRTCWPGWPTPVARAPVSLWPAWRWAPIDFSRPCGPLAWAPWLIDRNAQCQRDSGIVRPLQERNLRKPK
jgi:hypothetical protein